ncbi:MAG TPA: S9 family peptidase, partial [Thermoanaerobaculia bacterium]|nr:S9 family peptidase [Thermoanaerobaculia bacterium]
MKRLALAVLLLSSIAYADRWQPADRLRIVTASDPQISPDGETIVAVVSRANEKDNRYDAEIVTIDVASGTQRPLTFERRGIASPRWSPDGTRIAFLANATAEKDARRQIWVLPVTGGEARRLSDAARGVQQFAWSPDGSQIAFVTSDEPPKSDEKPLSFEVDDDDYLTREEPMPSHVWLIPSSGGAARRLTSGKWSLPIAHPPGPAPSPLSWSPDGKSIAITRRETPHAGTPNVARVALVDIASGETRRLTTSDLDESQAVFSPDGSRIAFWFPRDGKRGSANGIWITTASGGNGTSATASLDRNVFRAIWLPDGKSFLTGAHDGTTTAYYVVTLDGRTRKLDLGDIDPSHGFWPDATVSRMGAIAFTASTPSHPREIYVLSSIDAKPRQLTHLNDWVADRQLGKSEVITWRNDGFDMNGIVTYPPAFDSTKKYPLVVFIHGGPRSASTTGFSPYPQSFAAQGWVVLQPNYRGSDNAENAFTRAILDDSGAGPGRDVMAGIETLKKRGFIDDSRVGVGGWSYGGYMTTWMIGHYPIFKAAVSGAAVNNLVDQYVLGDGGPGRRLTWGSPYAANNIKKYVDQSPITSAASIKTPTLIMSDTGDVRVPVVQSYQLFRALRDNNVPVKFIAYPVSGHSPEDPLRQVDIEKRYV